ncbi:hypothetical protein BDM02DRAFT_2361425 [Thelephora ganbajun]|uniref:Uncharacterized protein n=1 Tax=Thelephora ganbajun TaxID=370292 RepID=A0ACB6ZF18_THEGA|nr:hypothetical protein BDM02DRAFT_2361425 [Thelephora ganbajun]
MGISLATAKHKGISGPSSRRQPQCLDRARVPARPLHATGRSLTFLSIGEPAGQQRLYSSRLACSNSVPRLQGIVRVIRTTYVRSVIPVDKHSVHFSLFFSSVDCHVD